MPKKTYQEDCIIDGHKLSLSMATEANGFVFVSGFISADKDTLALKLDCGIEDQVRNAMKLIERVLADADAKLDDIVKLNVFLSGQDVFPGYNETVKEFFSPGQEPARITTVGAFLLDGVLCEIDAIAYKG
jgi:2-iminobutanoate/2-iminopropanoate deaminase